MKSGIILAVFFYSCSLFALPDSPVVRQIKELDLTPYYCKFSGYLTSDANKSELLIKPSQVQAVDEKEARKFCLIKYDASMGYGPDSNELFIKVPSLSEKHHIVVEKFEVERVTLPAQ